MLKFKQFLIQYLNEGSLSSYTYTLPNNLEKEFFDFYVWSYFYLHLTNNIPHVGEDTTLNINQIVTEAIKLILNKNTETMKEALFLSIVSESKNFEKVNHEYETNKIISIYEPRSSISEDPDEEEDEEYEEYVIEPLKNLHQKIKKNQNSMFSIKEYKTINSLVKIQFGSIINFLQKMSQIFGDEDRTYGGLRWTQICSGLLNLYTKENSNLTEWILALDHCYDLEHNSGVAYNIITEMKWAPTALTFKYEDHKFEIANKSSIPQYITKYIFNLIGTKINKNYMLKFKSV